MTPKEAEKKYGKKIVMDMWEHINLESEKINYSFGGIDIPEYLWEEAYTSFIKK